MADFAPPESAERYRNRQASLRDKCTAYQGSRGRLEHILVAEQDLACGPAHTRYPAELQLYRQLLYQAADWAFVDVFRWLALLCLSGAGLPGSSSEYEKDARRPERDRTDANCSQGYISWAMHGPQAAGMHSKDTRSSGMG